MTPYDDLSNAMAAASEANKSYKWLRWMLETQKLNEDIWMTYDLLSQLFNIGACDAVNVHYKDANIRDNVQKKISDIIKQSDKKKAVDVELSIHVGL